jgi:hypothetical protein
MVAQEKISKDTIVVASKEMAAADLGDEVAILNTTNGVYYSLNPIGARIWSLIQEPRSVRDVCKTLVAQNDVDSEYCQQDAIALLQNLAENELVDVLDDAPARS